MSSKKAKRPSGAANDAKMLLDSIPKDSVSGLRDLALIAAMFYSFARVSAVLKLKVDDYYHKGARRRLRLHEKGGKEHEMPVHHLLEQILDEYIAAAGLQSGQPLFQSVNSLGTAVTGRALNRYNAWAAIRKRAKAAGFLTPVGCHTWSGDRHHDLPGERRTAGARPAEPLLGKRQRVLANFTLSFRRV
jgi:integrase/recombinase XerD